MEITHYIPVAEFDRAEFLESAVVEDEQVQAAAGLCVVVREPVLAVQFDAVAGVTVTFPGAGTVPVSEMMHEWGIA